MGLTPNKFYIENGIDIAGNIRLMNELRTLESMFYAIARLFQKVYMEELFLNKMAPKTATKNLADIRTGYSMTFCDDVNGSMT